MCIRDRYNGATVDGLSDNIEYHIWFYYKKETVTGNDGISWVVFADSSTYSRPALSGNKYNECVTGDADQNITVLMLQETHGNTIYFDQSLLRSTSLDTVCN
jgi:hypothetical protein